MRPDSLAQKQALAAVGQVHLMRYYDDLFSAVDMVRHAAAATPWWCHCWRVRQTFSSSADRWAHACQLAAGKRWAL